MSRSGLFISFEGIDGAGKSSHIDGLAQAFRAQGRNVTLSREPGGTPLAEKLRELVLNDPMDALTEALLIFAARRDHLCQVIEPALARGDVVLCDRFTDATFAYQGAGRGFDLAPLGTLETWVQQVRQPDLTLVFDVDPAVAAQRLSAARSPDRFEAEDTAFFQKVRAGYQQRIDATPTRYAVIDAGQTPEVVAEQVQAVLTERGWW